MKVTTWVSENYNNIQSWLKPLVRGDLKNFNDFVHDIIIIFMEDEKAEELIDNNQARWYIVRVALNQFRSNTSKYTKTYKPPFLEFLTDFDYEDNTDYNYEEDIVIETLLNCLDEMYRGSNKHRYYSMLILLYSSLNNNYSEVARRLNIQRTTVSKLYKEGVKVLLKKFKEKIDTDDLNIEINNISIKILTTQILKNYGK